MYVPVWDLHNWLIWHIWSFLSSALLWSFSDLAAGDVYRKTKLVDCVKLSWLLTSFLPESSPASEQELPTLRCTLRWRETGREIRVSLEDSLLISSLDHLSLPHYHSPNHWKDNLWVFLPQNCNTACVSANPFQVWVGNSCYSHITKNGLWNIALWLVLESWKDKLTISITSIKKPHFYYTIFLLFIIFLKWPFFKKLKLTDAEKFNICSCLYMPWPGR